MDATSCCSFHSSSVWVASMFVDTLSYCSFQSSQVWLPWMFVAVCHHLLILPEQSSLSRQDICGCHLRLLFSEHSSVSPQDVCGSLPPPAYLFKTVQFESPGCFWLSVTSCSEWIIPPIQKKYFMRLIWNILLSTLLSGVTFHVSHVTCHVSHVTFF